MAQKIKTIDLFAGCGGIVEGFEMAGMYQTIAAVEWEKAPCENLRKHLKDRWSMDDADERVLRFDIQRYNELFHGWNNDKNYGASVGLDALVSGQKVDLVIGGPPCQAYSIAGRVRDEHGMKNDYRNFLFESYVEVVKHYRPKAFVFENVPGILSATPNDEPIIDVIQRTFDDAGYMVLQDLSKAIIDFSEYGVPQNRKRIVILGVSKSVYGDQANNILQAFYTDVMPKHKVDKKVTVRHAIGDLPLLIPLSKDVKHMGRRYSHSFEVISVPNHLPRWHNKRDIDIFKILTTDIETGRKEYVTANTLKELYTKHTGKESNVHKYHVIRWDETSNLIPAHLYKDGLRHIHPDSKQARTITVREAARLQGFPDDYEFIGGQVDQFKMIGNAVPPIFSLVLAQSIYELLFIGGD